MNLTKIRSEVLQTSKNIIEKNGWNENLFFLISQNCNYKEHEINTLFPNGYESLLTLYLTEINEKMTEKSKSLNLIRLKIHERIKALMTIRLNIMKNEKKLISKTFLYLLLPHNFKIASQNLYKTVDQIWFLAGDNSTDFNFYSKRAILASIYTTTLLHFINNDNIDETIDVMNQNLKKVSKIPKIKNQTKNIIKLLPNIIQLKNKFSFVKQ
jgi:ubiquinone biosynthesis protein COQ9|tara:strand:- start:330 stop:965 length:636 start_codon:yes stop_codon:yes gene_type:complete